MLRCLLVFLQFSATCPLHQRLAPSLCAALHQWGLWPLARWVWKWPLTKMNMVWPCVRHPAQCFVSKWQVDTAQVFQMTVGFCSSCAVYILRTPWIWQNVCKSTSCYSKNHLCNENQQVASAVHSRVMHCDCLVSWCIHRLLAIGFNMLWCVMNLLLWFILLLHTVCSVLQWWGVFGRRSYWPLWAITAWTRSNLSRLQYKNHMKTICLNCVWLEYVLGVAVYAVS